MEAITTIKLYGNLAKKYGDKFEFKGINTIIEAIDALSANFKDFRNTVISNRKYHVYIDNYNIDIQEMLLPTSNKVIKIVPILMGASGGLGKVILGGILAAGAIFFSPLLGAFAPILLKAGIGLMLSGFADLIFQPPEDNPDDVDKSYLFSGSVNIVQEGVPVPIGYGRVKIGSTNISNSISSYSTAAGENNGC